MAEEPSAKKTKTEEKKTEEAIVDDPLIEFCRHLMNNTIPFFALYPSARAPPQPVRLTIKRIDAAARVVQFHPVLSNDLPDSKGPNVDLTGGCGTRICLDRVELNDFLFLPLAYEVSERPGPYEVSERPGPYEVSERPGPYEVSERPGPYVTRDCWLANAARTVALDTKAGRSAKDWCALARSALPERIIVLPSL